MATDGALIRVLTADDHPVVRAGIAAMLANEPDLVVVAEEADGVEAVALIDLLMPRLDGVGAIQPIRAVDPGARLVARLP
jgi:two-component system NarL family response regulator